MLEKQRGELKNFTADIPNISEIATKDLDENGMIRVGTKVKTGDILIGKITPKGESDPTPEEKLLRAIFGEKAGDVKDASKAKPSHQGVVISKSLFSKSLKTKKDRIEDKEKVKDIENDFNVTKEKLKSRLVSKLYGIIGGKAAKRSAKYFR